MKIAIIEPVGAHGGMNYYDYGLAKGLSRAGVHVILYTSGNTVFDGEVPFEVKNTFRNIWGGSPKVIRAAWFLFGLLSSLINARINQVKVVHFHFFHYTFLEYFSVMLSKVFKFKVVITAHDVESLYESNDSVGAKRVLSYADRIIAHNILSKKILVEDIGIDNICVSIIPHGNYIESISEQPGKEESRKFLGIAQSHTVILFFGQIKKIKGLDILLNALPEVIKVFPDLKLVIAGKEWKDDFSRYQEIIKNNGLSDFVIPRVQYIPDEQVSSYFRASDLVVLPYKKIYQSGVLLMAMSYKAPVLVSDIPGMTEIIDNDVNGFLFKSEDSENLASRLVNILGNKKELMRVANSGYEKVIEEHNWDNIGLKMDEEYNAICSNL